MVNDDRLRVRQALTVALPDLKENKYDEMMEVIEDIISHKELVKVFEIIKVNKRHLKLKLPIDYVSRY